MQEQGGPEPRRRRRVRHPAEAEAEPVAVTLEIDDQVVEAVVVGADDAPPSERGLRGLVGGGSSQVRTPAALRARDAARPRESDRARAETELVIVRRNWSPRD